MAAGDQPVIITRYVVDFCYVLRASERGATVAGRQFADEEQQDDGDGGGDQRSARLCCRTNALLKWSEFADRRFTLRNPHLTNSHEVQ